MLLLLTVDIFLCCSVKLSCYSQFPHLEIRYTFFCFWQNDYIFLKITVL